MDPTPEERQLLSIAKSKLWRWMADYLRERRETLFRQESKSDGELWKKEGAIQEINRLLRAPDLVLQWYRATRSSNPQASQTAEMSAFSDRDDDPARGSSPGPAYAGFEDF